MLGQRPHIGGAEETYSEAPGAVGELREFIQSVSVGGTLTDVYQIRRLIYNNTGATLVAKRFHKFDTTSSLNVVAATDNEHAKNCVLPTADVPDDKYAWAVVRGLAIGKADAAVTAGNPVTVESGGSGVAGAVDDTAVAGIEHTLVATAKETVGAAGDILLMVHTI